MCKLSKPEFIIKLNKRELNDKLNMNIKGSLDLRDNNIITDSGIKGLKDLMSLNLKNNSMMTDSGIK